MVLDRGRLGWKDRERRGREVMASTVEEEEEIKGEEERRGVPLDS